MTQRISTRRTEIRSLNTIDAGRAVRGMQAIDTAHLTNWTLGRGAQLIAGHVPGGSLSAGTQYRFSYRIQPRAQAIERLWSIDLRTSTATGVTCSVSINGGTAFTLPATFSNATTPPANTLPHKIRETLGSQSSTEATVTIDITPTGGSAVLYGLSCFEVPRAVLSNSATEDGTEVIGMNPGNPAKANVFANILDVTDDGSKIGRRCTLAHWGVPHATGTPPTTTTTAFAIPITNTTYEDVRGALYLPALDRKIGKTATTSVIAVKLLAWVTGGSGDFQVITASGTSAGVNITATTPTFTSAASVTVHCEDLASTDGRQTAASPAFDTLQIQARKNVSGTLYIAGWAAIGTG